MTSTGSVQMQNVLMKPQMISLSTSFAQQKDSTLSDVSWNLRDIIRVVDPNFTAVVSLYSMIFYNTFANITKSNKTLKVITTYNVNGVPFTPIIKTVVLPEGHYDLTTLLDYLNTAGVCNSVGLYNNGASVFYAGLGGQTTQTTAAVAANPTPILNTTATFGDSFLVNSQDNSKLQLNSANAGGGPWGVWDPLFEYTAVGLVYDDDTRGCMSTLGFTDFTYGNSKPTNIASIVGTNLEGIVIPVYHGSGASKYRYVSPVAAGYTTTVVEQGVSSVVNAINLGGPPCISVSWEQLPQAARNSYDQLSATDTFAIVPLAGAYGTKNVYQPALPFKVLVPNFSANEFHIRIKNSATGQLVDFQNIDWMLNIGIEFFEIENTLRSEAYHEGYGQTVMPLFHHEIMNHNLPYSGVHGEHARRKRKT
jgi:hypothetical protein